MAQYNFDTYVPSFDDVKRMTSSQIRELQSQLQAYVNKQNEAVPKSHKNPITGKQVVPVANENPNVSKARALLNQIKPNVFWDLFETTRNPAMLAEEREKKTEKDRVEQEEAKRIQSEHEAEVEDKLVAEGKATTPQQYYNTIIRELEREARGEAYNENIFKLVPHTMVDEVLDMLEDYLAKETK